MHNTIFAFKENLLKAIILPGDDGVRDSQASRWEAMAFAVRRSLNVKPPCDNCRRIFRRLEGFILNGPTPSGPTFLGACAEYCPVNSLLTDDPVTLREQILILRKEKSHREQCTQLFQRYREIADTCEEAYKRYVYYGQIEHLQADYENILPTLFIFGFDPHGGL